MSSGTALLILYFSFCDVLVCPRTKPPTSSGVGYEPHVPLCLTGTACYFWHSPKVTKRPRPKLPRTRVPVVKPHNRSDNSSLRLLKQVVSPLSGEVVSFTNRYAGYAPHGQHNRRCSGGLVVQ